MKINGHRIAPGAPVYIIAEMSANHNGSFEHAAAIVRAAKEAGADAVKIQTYTADTMTLKLPQKHFKIGGGTLWDGRTLYDLYEEAHMPWEWQPKLKKLANQIGIDLFSSPFDSTAVDFLEKMDVPAYKVASFEIVDIPLIERIARTGRPLIISTGMATLEEIREAVEAARGAGARDIALLKCTSAYPAPPEEMNLNTIPDLAREFGMPIGLSDHTMGIAVPVAAVALGACLIEKHFTLSRAEPGPDSAFSLEPAELKAMVDAVRTVEKALGSVRYGVTKDQEKNRAFRRSLFAVNDVRKGDVFTEDNVRAIRPGNGLPPKHLSDLLGKTATQDIVKGTPLQWDHVAAARRKKRA
jgi:N-acetylneuraminate synthase